MSCGERVTATDSHFAGGLGLTELEWTLGDLYFVGIKSLQVQISSLKLDILLLLTAKLLL